MEEMTLADFEALKAMVRPQDLHRLRPDGLLNPELPPMCLCGGLESPYLLGQTAPIKALTADAAKRILPAID